MALSGSNWLWKCICGNPMVLGLFSNEPLRLLLLTFHNQGTAWHQRLKFILQQPAFSLLPNSSSIPEPTQQEPATPQHVGELQRKEQLLHVSFEYVPHRKLNKEQNTLWLASLPMLTLMQFLFLLQKEKCLMGRIIAASEFLVIMQNEECHQSITRGLTSGHRQVTILM